MATKKRKTGLRCLDGESPNPPSVSLACSTEPISYGDPSKKNLEDNSDVPDMQLSWRPPTPIEDGIWIPIHVKTNGEGKMRLIYPDPLVEVYEINVNLCGKAYGKIHGKIFLDCTGYRTYLFNCDKQSALTIQKKGSLPLYGTDIAPIGFDPVWILIDLDIDDEKLCKDYIKWDYSSYDKWLYDEVKGKNGSVSVTYAVMENAWLVDLEVKLIKSVEEKTDSRIYGDIVVYLNDMKYLRYFVFNKKNDDCITIKSLDAIPLSRSLFNCCCGSSLVVKVDLWNADTGKPFARGALLFHPEYFGDSVGTLGSQNVIQVKLNYMLHDQHSKTRSALNGCQPWSDLWRYTW